MSTSEYRFTLDIRKNHSQISLPCVLGDTARRLIVSLSEDEKPYAVPDGALAVFAAKKPDGTALLNSCEINERGEIIYDFTPQTANVPGITECRIRLYDLEEKLISSPRFELYVDERAVNDEDIPISEAERTAIDAMLSAETLRIARENMRITNEARREDNEDERDTAEEERASAETLRATSETQRRLAETSRASAEASRATAEASRASAESSRSSSETARRTAETSRASAETVRKASEDDREEAEAIRAVAEDERTEAEEARNEAEEERSSSESARGSAEASRAAAESGRRTAESARASAESARASAETARGTAETARRTAETARASAEAVRAANETARISAENARKTVIVAYSENEDGSDYSYTWEDGMKYLGVANAHALPTTKTDFQWQRIKGNGITSVDVTHEGDTQTITITLDDGTTTSYDVIDSAVTSVNGKTGIITDILEKDGDYGNTSTTVGNARQLVSSVGVTDKVPYLFRTSGGAASIGNRENDTVVGGTLCWNQIIDNGNFKSKTGWNTIGCTWSVASNVATLTKTQGNPSGIQKYFPASRKGHKFLMTAELKGNLYLGVFLTNYAGDFTTHSQVNNDGEFHRHAVIGTASEGATIIMIRFLSAATSPVGDIGEVRNVQMFDLTEMFGNASSAMTASTFPAMFPKPYYAYNEGELMSVCTNAHKMTGFNQWDEEWEIGAYNDVGEKVSSTTAIRSKNYIRVVPGKQIYIKAPARLVLNQYREDKTFIRRSNARGAVTALDDECCSITFTCGYSEEPVTTYNNDICINYSWSGSRNGEYEVYSEHIYPLSPKELRGVPKLGSDGRLYYDGDTYTHDGTLTRRFKKRAYESGDENLPDAVTDKVNTVVALETPTTETATPFADPEAVDDFGTEEYVDALATAGEDARDVAIPVGHETFYQANLRDKLQNLPDNAAENGHYLVKQQGERQVLVAHVNELPQAPSATGTYVLKLVDGVLTWTEEQ